jgi:hypothetical protein
MKVEPAPTGFIYMIRRFLKINIPSVCRGGFYQGLKYAMNNVGKPALYGLMQPTIGTFFFPGNHLICR